MAIIKKSLHRLRHYPFLALKTEAVVLLLTEAQRMKKYKTESPSLTVHILECFCDLTCIEVTAEVLLSSAIIPIYEKFCGAMVSKNFADLSLERSKSICRTLGKLLQRIRSTKPNLAPIYWEFAALPDLKIEWEEQKIEFPAEKITYWSGWHVENRYSEVRYLNLAQLWHSHGQTFTETIHKGIRIYSEGSAAPTHYLFTPFISFLVENRKSWPPDTFQDPNKIYSFFCALILHIFKHTKADDQNLPMLKKSWNKFIGLIYKMYIDSRNWAAPYRHLPLTDAKAIRGNSTHISMTSEGIEVKTKLITHIPIHLNERLACEKLIIQIKDEIKIVRSWATKQSLETVERFDNRKILAQSATCLDKDSDDFYGKTFINNLSALFEKETYKLYLPKVRATLKQKKGLAHSSSKLGYSLGVPTTLELYPFQCLLILEHPSITNSFLSHFDLCDKDGKITGFVSEGAKSYLVTDYESKIISGIKGRKGKKRSRQKFELTDTAASVMADLVKITQPARDYLRSKGDESFRKLFIASPICTSEPMVAQIPHWNKSTLNLPSYTPIIEQFHQHTEKRGEYLKKYLARLSPSTIRASRCVEEYLETGSTSLMSQCLGHDEEDSILLESYLPETFSQFIEGQGVKIVHKAIICHALRDSPFLVEGANFESLEILEQFLKNYAIKNIPDYLKNPNIENATKVDQDESELLLRLGIGSLTALLSLEAAVNQSRDQRLVSESAKDWARLTALIVKDIECGTDQLLKDHLKTAKTHANPSRMEKLIYAK